MSLKLLYFARLREMVGMPGEVVELPPDVTDVAALRAWLVARGGVWQQALGNERQVRVARNQEVVAETALLEEGDEVAFFPPVTGG